MTRSVLFVGVAVLLGAAGVACSNDVQVAASSATGGPGSTTSTGGAPSTSTVSTTSSSMAEGGSSSSGVGGNSQLIANKVDLLLMIDNSRSMADKQLLLKQAVPYLTSALVNPTCVDASGMATATQPSGPLDACQPGSQRIFAPIVDMHVGVITSSIGGHGSNICADSDETADDHGRLVSRTDAMASNGSIATYQNEGFLAWDPTQMLAPPGLTDASKFEATVQDLVVGAGQIGCGYEAQLEAWYRFLVDPDPYQTISVVNTVATPMGLDAVLLQERSDFMRPDSLLVVVMLSDENDCSIKEYGPYWVVAQQGQQMPAARSECATNPKDPCCLSCGQDQGVCPPEPDVCGAGAPSNPTMISSDDDNTSLRCWDQKRRYGIDFLYPIDRYTQALTSATITDNQGNLTPNPIFAGGRPQGLAMLTSIVGVPWQDLARDPNDAKKGFYSSAELAANGAWAQIIGDPSAFVPPADPLMIESVDKRIGTNPATGAVLKSCPDHSNPVNGCEWDIINKDDLQYACIFPLQQPRDCGAMTDSCDCGAPPGGMPPDSPLCDGTIQLAAKAYPGVRELAVTESVGDQGVVGSICPAQTSNPTQADFGYAPTIAALLASASGHLVK